MVNCPVCDKEMERYDGGSYGCGTCCIHYRAPLKNCDTCKHKGVETYEIAEGHCETDVVCYKGHELKGYSELCEDYEIAITSHDAPPFRVRSVTYEEGD